MRLDGVVDEMEKRMKAASIGFLVSAATSANCVYICASYLVGNVRRVAQLSTASTAISISPTIRQMCVSWIGGHHPLIQDGTSRRCLEFGVVTRVWVWAARSSSRRTVTDCSTREGFPLRGAAEARGCPRCRLRTEPRDAMLGRLG